MIGMFYNFNEHYFHFIFSLKYYQIKNKKDEIYRIIICIYTRGENKFIEILQSNRNTLLHPLYHIFRVAGKCEHVNVIITKCYCELQVMKYTFSAYINKSFRFQIFELYLFIMLRYFL